jgi:predicted  nucleic acid-binding Zn-ribbon protein
LNHILQEQVVLKDILGQLYLEKMAAPSKEDDIMNDIAEIKTKVYDIDGTVRKIESDLAVVKNTIDLKFDQFSKSIDELKSMDSKIESKLDKIIEKMDSYVTKEEFHRATDRKRFTITTWIALASALASIGTVVVSIIKH